MHANNSDSSNTTNEDIEMRTDVDSSSDLEPQRAVQTNYSRNSGSSHERESSCVREENKWHWKAEK